MDLIDGAPLGEHFNALKEKQKIFNEERIWNIFIQVKNNTGLDPLTTMVERLIKLEIVV